MKKKEDKCFPFVFSRLCVRYLKKKQKTTIYHVQTLNRNKPETNCSAGEVS